MTIEKIGPYKVPDKIVQYVAYWDNQYPDCKQTVDTFSREVIVRTSHGSLRMPYEWII